MLGSWGGVVWGLGAGEVVAGLRGGFGSETRGAAELTDFTDATGPAGVLMCTGRRFMAHVAASERDSPSWNFTCRQQPCQACRGHRTAGSGQGRMTGEKKAAGDSVLILECLRTMRQNVMPGTLSSPVGFFFAAFA